MNLVRVIPFISWGLPANALRFGGPDPSQNRGMKRLRSSLKPWKAPRPGPLDRVPKLLKRAEDLRAAEGVKAGDFVLRWLSGVPTPMRLEVMSVTAERICCAGGWEFDPKTGAEIDKALGWGPDTVTGSFIRPERG